MSTPSFHKRDENRGKHWQNYWPLLALTCVTGLAAYALMWGGGEGLMEWMHYFMGFFLCIFALLKAFHLGTFANGFQMYDLLGKHWRGYAFAYPAIELLLGLAYLSYIAPIATYLFTAFFFLFGSVGVVLALRKGLDINCPCMGSILQVPLSTVTLAEDIAMAGMAALMWVMAAGYIG